MFRKWQNSSCPEIALKSRTILALKIDYYSFATAKIRRRILFVDLCVASGVRPAHAGEFTSLCRDFHRK